MCTKKRSSEGFGDLITSYKGGFLNTKLLSNWTFMLYFEFEQLMKTLANVMKNRGEVVPKFPILVEWRYMLFIGTTKIVSKIQLYSLQLYMKSLKEG